MNMDLAGQGKPWISLKAMIPSLVVNIIFNLILIPIYGAKGAAIASTLSYSLAAFLFIHFYSKETGIPAKEIFKFRKNDFDPLIKILRKLVSK
jgi:Na+-driven multidrug efflux pump